MIVHYDLFAGIGGFSLALDNIYGKTNTKHIFVERDEFCQLVLKKHWPEAEYHNDISHFIANTKCQQINSQNERRFCTKSDGSNTIILTGGFPCQPFSQAGRRKGTDDDRYLWPAMLESIKLIRPNWIIAENVAGLVTWSEGMVLEQVCSDLESEGYEVQPFIIPACAVKAPHRRDRVWIVANCTNSGPEDLQKSEKRAISNTNSNGLRLSRSGTEQNGEGSSGLFYRENKSWRQNWLEVATRLCRMDDGLSRRMDRSQRLKALGNAIVPQVAEEILKFICLNPS